MPGLSVGYWVWLSRVHVDTSPVAKSLLLAGPPLASRLSPNGTHVRITMTGDTRNEPDVSTAAEFNAALTELLDQAHAAGVDVQGAWACRTNDGGPDWEAAVVELDDGN
jgi:hypothetical protein